MPKSKLDPLFAAIIAKLPASGATWEAKDRDAWLHMMTSAFNVVYGAETGAQANTAVTSSFNMQIAQMNGKRKPGRPPKAKAHAGHDYYIDKEGFAHADGGGRVSPEDVPDGELIFDYRGAKRDRDTIIWADGSTGARPGQSFCGPG